MRSNPCHSGPSGKRSSDKESLTFSRKTNKRFRWLWLDLNQAYSLSFSA
jgi:hypothetical protein